MFATVPSGEVSVQVRSPTTPCARPVSVTRTFEMPAVKKPLLGTVKVMARPVALLSGMLPPVSDAE